ncbi:MAG: ATP-binding protein [Alphaproteobacteria bacterium]|nr:ATP-binding protein [Alphaproteobacteria bacterium]
MAAGGRIVSAIYWVKVTDDRLADQIAEALGKETEIFDGAALPDDGQLGLLIVDDAHADLVPQVDKQAFAGAQTVLITQDPASGRADFVLPADVDASVLKPVFTAAREFRDQMMSLQADVASRQSAVGTINYGQFVLTTLEEARNLSTMLALACPNSDVVAIGLQELLVNAVEHGNLEITAEEKQALIIDGSWRDEVERRLRAPEFAGRVVLVNFQRGERLIAITVQDDGAGFDYSAYVESDTPSEGYRGRGIAMARDLSFSSIAYLGRGNVVEATILLERDDEN